MAQNVRKKVGNGGGGSVAGMGAWYREGSRSTESEGETGCAEIRLKRKGENGEKSDSAGRPAPPEGRDGAVNGLIFSGRRRR